MPGDPQPLAPQLMPPKMEVGYNYTWPFNAYGVYMGPGSRQDRFVALALNLGILKNELKIKKVRIFLLCNAFNYGPAPFGPLFGQFSFDPPDRIDQLFLDHFKQMLGIFRDVGCEMLPSLLDFGAFLPPGIGGGSGRADIANNTTFVRQRFIDGVLTPFLDVSQSQEFKNLIFAWEVVNEPVWATKVFKPGSVIPHGIDVQPGTMSDFLHQCLEKIEKAGFPSTVGHRYVDDLASFPTGTKPQFHYYLDPAHSDAWKSPSRHVWRGFPEFMIV